MMIRSAFFAAAFAAAGALAVTTLPALAHDRPISATGANLMARAYVEMCQKHIPEQTAAAREACRTGNLPPGTAARAHERYVYARDVMHLSRRDAAGGVAFWMARSLFAPIKEAEAPHDMVPSKLPPPRLFAAQWAHQVCRRHPGECAPARAAASACPSAGYLAALYFRHHATSSMMTGSLDPATIRYILRLRQKGVDGPNTIRDVESIAVTSCFARAASNSPSRLVQLPVAPWDAP